MKNSIIALLQKKLIVFLSLVITTNLASQTVTLTPGEKPISVVTPSVRIEFDTLPNKFYRIESSEDLSNWKPEGYAFAGNGQRLSALVSNHGLYRLFYRIRNDATPAETAPIIPYGMLNQSGGIGVPRPITPDVINPFNDRLLLMDAISRELRSLPFSDLQKIAGFTNKWGDIKGILSDQKDLVSALNGKFSVLNPPNWQDISRRPTSLLGYGIIDAVSTSHIGFMDRFARYADNTVLITGQTLPEYGNAWRFNIAGKTLKGIDTISVSASDSSFNDSANGILAQGFVPGDWLYTGGFSNPSNNGNFRVTSVTAGKITVTLTNGNPAGLVDESSFGSKELSGAFPPLVTNGALRAADKTLIYIGAPTKTVNGRFSMTIEAELKPSIYSSAVFNAGITIGIQSSQLLFEQGGLSLHHLIHCLLNETGVHDNGIYGLTPGFTPEGGGTHPIRFVQGKQFQRNVKYLIQLVVEGDEMRVSGNGGTIVYRDSRISSIIGDPDTHWFYETAGDSLGHNQYANVWHLHRIWVNAPELDRANGWGVPDSNNFVNSPSSVPSAISPPSSSNLVSGTSGIKTQLISITGSLLTQSGTHERSTIHGNFSNNNRKSMTLQVGGLDVWSSGDLQDSGEWTVEIDRVRENMNTYQLHIKYESDVTRRLGFHRLKITDNSTYSIDLKGTSLHDGDILVRAALNGGSLR